MYLGKRIKEIREEKNILQRQLAASLEIDTAMFSKFERGERRAKREQVLKLAELLDTDKDDLITLWLADQIKELVKDEDNARDALSMVINNLDKL